MPYIIANGVKMYYEVHGSGPPLVLAHHMFGDCQFTWSRHLPHFARHYTTVIYDLRGHGRSDNPAPRLFHSDLADDLAALIRALGLGPTPVVGVSTGGMALLWLAVRAPDLISRLVISDATYHFKGQQLHEGQAVALADLAAFRDATQLDQRHSAIYGSEHWRTLAAEWARWRLDPGERHFPPLAALASFTPPTLIIHGDRDEFFPPAIPAALYAAFPNGQLAIAPQTRHLVHAFAPRFWREAVLGFLGAAAN